MTARTALLEPFDALVGTWATEATHPAFDAVVAGTVTFAWWEGGHFLLAHSTNDHEAFPDALQVIGPDEGGDGVVAEYFDSRGVRRTYRASFEGGLLRFWRDAAGFDQRFSARVERGGFLGRWELAETPGAWRPDLEVRYQRLGEPT